MSLAKYVALYDTYSLFTSHHLVLSLSCYFGIYTFLFLTFHFQSICANPCYPNLCIDPDTFFAFAKQMKNKLWNITSTVWISWVFFHFRFLRLVQQLIVDNIQSPLRSGPTAADLFVVSRDGSDMALGRCLGVLVYRFAGWGYRSMRGILHVVDFFHSYAESWRRREPTSKQKPTRKSGTASSAERTTNLPAIYTE